MTLHRFIFLGVCLLPSVLFAASDKLIITEKVNDFYQSWLAKPSVAITDLLRVQQTKNILSPELSCLLYATERYVNSYKLAFPNAKILLEQNDLLSSAAIKPQKFSVVQVTKNAREAHVVLRFSYQQNFFKINKSNTYRKDVVWFDRLTLKKIDGTWLVSNVFYRGNFALGNQGDLLQILRRELSVVIEGMAWLPKNELLSCKKN